MRVLSVEEQIVVGGGWLKLLGRAATVLGGVIAAWYADKQLDNIFDEEDKRARILDTLNSVCEKHGLHFTENPDGTVVVSCKMGK